MFPGLCSKCVNKKVVKHIEKLQNEEGGKSFCGGCSRIVIKVFECYVSNKLKYRCLNCCNSLKVTHKTFSFKKKTNAELRYGSFWKNHLPNAGGFKKDEQVEVILLTGDGVGQRKLLPKKEAEELVAIKRASMASGSKNFGIFFPYGENASNVYPMLFTFLITEAVRSFSFIDKKTGQPRSRESVEIFTTIMEGNNAVHQGYCTTSEDSIIRSIKRDIGPNHVGAVGVMVYTDLKDGVPVGDAFFSYNPPDEKGLKLTKEKLLEEAWKALSEKESPDQPSPVEYLQNLFSSIEGKDGGKLFNFTKERPMVRDVTKFCLFTPFASVLIENFRKNGGVTEAPEELPF